MVSWGIVTTCTGSFFPVLVTSKRPVLMRSAAVTNYEGLIVCRVFLGIAEAGFL